MIWRKLGRVFVADGHAPWAMSAAYVPTADPSGRGVRVYAAFLDRHDVGRVGYVDLDPSNLTRVTYVSPDPVLDIGAPGTFDDNGVTPTTVLSVGSEKYLYYFGWQIGVKVRYYLFAGLAISTDGGNTFRRYSQAPILDRTDGELFLRSAPTVINDQDKWKMWYVSGDQFVDIAGKPTPTYRIRYTESPNGRDWLAPGVICMDFNNADEFGFGRPYVLKEHGLYRMFYSVRHRSKGYRMGYAESSDGLNWKRMDGEIGLDISPSGWDSEYVCFGSIIDYRGSRYMFYNGSHAGRTGFGVAVLDRE